MRILIQRQQYLAARLCQQRPAVGTHRVAQGRVRTLHLVRRKQQIVGQRRANLGIQRIESGRVERQRLHRTGTAASVLGIEGDQNGQVPRMRLRPLTDNRQTVLQSEAAAAKIDVGQMHDLETGTPHLLPLGGRPGRLRIAATVRPGRLQITSALRVGVDVELQAAQASVELFGQRPMRVVDRIGSRGIDRAMRGQLVVRQRQFVAVVGADELQLVHAQMGIHPIRIAALLEAILPSTRRQMLRTKTLPPAVQPRNVARTHVSSLMFRTGT